MMDVGTAMQATMNKHLIHFENEVCPSCNQLGTLWQWPTLEGRKSRGGAVCIACGLMDVKKKERANATDITISSRKSMATRKLKSGSLLTDGTIWGRNFNNFRVPDAETLLAKQKMQAWSDEIAKGEPNHIILLGGTGTGKTHLAISALYDYLDKIDYSREFERDDTEKPDHDRKRIDYGNKCLFVSYRELLEQLKFAMNDDQVRREITGNLMRDIKSVELVVIDDIGAELGDFSASAKATNFNVDTLTSLTEARVGKATIFTSNLTSRQLVEAYGNRVFSRIVDGMEGRAITFENTKDKRIHAV